MKIQHHPPSSISEELDQICENAKKHEQQVVLLNFQMGDLLNLAVKAMGLNAKEVGDIFETRSGINSTVIQTNGRIARRIPKELRPENLSWSVIKYIIIDINPKGLKTLGYVVDDSDFCAAGAKALKEIELQGLTWTEVKQEDEGGISVGEKMIIKHFK